VLLLVALTIAIFTIGLDTAAADGNDPPEGGWDSIVAITLPSREAVDQLIERNVDLVEYLRQEDDGRVTVNAVVNDDELAELRAAGYDIGRTVENHDTYLARMAERDAALSAEERSHDAAENGVAANPLSQPAFMRNALLAGEITVNRVDFFQNYAGWFLSTEVYDSAVNGTGTSGPTVSISWKTATGSYTTAVTMPRYIDSDPTPDVYLYNTSLIRIGPASPPYGTGTAPDPPVSVRIGSSTAGVAPVEAPVRTWLGNPLPATSLNFNTQYFTAYMDPTQVKTRFESLATEFAGLAELITLPEQSPGYQRKSMCMMFSTTACSGSPGTASQAVYLESKLYGQNGGNLTRAQFRNPGAANSPLSVTVTPTGVNPGQADIVVNLQTSATGALASTAAQVVAAINADPAASALVTAFPYGGQTGTGIVPARALVSLSDFLAAPASVARGPFPMRVLRIGADVGKSPANSHHVGVYLYCQQHAREWVTSLTCLQTAEMLLRNYATDAHTKELLDNLDIFILPTSNPDRQHYSLYDFASQRRNLVRYCPLIATSGMPTNRNAWGVDLNRNSSQYSLFDGYFGASTSCTSDTYAGPSEFSEAENRDLAWVVDTYPNIKFANNIHTYGGYFMWAPGSYIGAGRISAPAPNQGIEAYFFAAADGVLGRIKSVRGTTVLPGRTGPIADVLYSAAGNGADEMWYRKGIIAYSFEAGSDRFSSTSTGTAQTEVGFQPSFANEGRFEALEFAAGNYGLLESAIAYERDHDPPVVDMTGARITQGAPIETTFKWVSEPSVVYYTTDGSAPTLSSPKWERQRLRGPGQVFTLSSTTTYRWLAVDIAGNSSTGQQRFAIDPNAPTTAAGISPAAINGYYQHPEVTLTANDDVPGGGAGVDKIQYRVDGGPTTTYSAPFAVTGDGSHTVEYFATDLAGNVEATKSATFSVDATAPTVDVAADRPADHNGWYNHDVTFTPTGNDAGSGIDTCDAAVTFSGPDSETSGPIAFTCTDRAGNTGAGSSGAFKYDESAPTVTVTPGRPADHNGWYNHAIKFSAAGDDHGASGIDNCDADVLYSGPDGSSSGPLAFTCRDNAGNVGEGSSGTFRYDATKPAIAITSPLDGAVFLINDLLNGNYSCSDGTSTVDTCVGPVMPGSVIATAIVGFHTFTVNAQDLAGNTQTRTNTYEVVWPFTGFFSPIDAAPTVNVANAGSSIPVKFALAGDRGLGIFAPGYPKSARIACASGAPEDLLEQTATPGSSTLSYGSGQYHYVWKSDKAWAGTCRELTVRFVDGSEHGALFRFK
jgi:hypothetical protein